MPIVGMDLWIGRTATVYGLLPSSGHGQAGRGAVSLPSTGRADRPGTDCLTACLAAVGDSPRRTSYCWWGLRDSYSSGERAIVPLHSE
jgi:hypothetical protein